MTQEIFKPTVHLTLDHSEKSNQALFLLKLTGLPYETTFADGHNLPAANLEGDSLLFEGLVDVELLIGTLSPEVYLTWLQNGRSSKNFQIPRRN